MTHQREKIADVSLILLSAQNPWNTVEVGDVGLKENRVLLYFKSDSLQEHRAVRRPVICTSYKAIAFSILATVVI